MISFRAIWSAYILFSVQLIDLAKCGHSNTNHKTERHNWCVIVMAWEMRLQQTTGENVLAQQLNTTNCKDYHHYFGYYCTMVYMTAERSPFAFILRAQILGKKIACDRVMSTEKRSFSRTPEYISVYRKRKCNSGTERIFLRFSLFAFRRKMVHNINGSWMNELEFSQRAHHVRNS